MGVFVNTMVKTPMVGVSGTHWVNKNGFRFPRGRFPLFAYKWSYNIAIWAVRDWMAWGAAVGEP